jgi:sporulation protein YlmC with PRC-barrel domain
MLNDTDRAEEAEMCLVSNRKKETIDMEIPLSADVRCGGSSCGSSVAIVLNPVTEQVTHLVVKEGDHPHTQRLVPVDLVVQTTPKEIELRCSPAELSEMDPFVETEFLRTDLPYYGTDAVVYHWAFVRPKAEGRMVLVQHERIPPGELTIRRGAPVRGTDALLGKVDEFLVDPTDSHITHLVLREGHIWGQKDVSIPVSEIDRIHEDVVYLRLSKQEVQALPTVPIQR